MSAAYRAPVQLRQAQQHRQPSLPLAQPVSSPHTRSRTVAAVRDAGPFAELVIAGYTLLFEIPLFV